MPWACYWNKIGRLIWNSLLTRWQRSILATVSAELNTNLALDSVQRLAFRLSFQIKTQRKTNPKSEVTHCCKGDGELQFVSTCSFENLESLEFRFTVTGYVRTQTQMQKLVGVILGYDWCRVCVKCTWIVISAFVVECGRHLKVTNSHIHCKMLIHVSQKLLCRGVVTTGHQQKVICSLSNSSNCN